MPRTATNFANASLAIAGHCKHLADLREIFLAIAPLFCGPIRLATGGIAGFLSAGIGAR